jgi:hypothetical protein
MQKRNRVFTAQGVLSLFAVSVLLGYAAHAVQPAAARWSVGAQEPQQAQPDPNETKSTVFTGTVVKRGSGFILREPTGTFYRLDAPSKVQPFEGKSVQVAGKLEEKVKLIHVEDIKELSA